VAAIGLVVLGAAASGAATRPKATPRAPLFTLFEAPTELLGAGNAGEPSIGANWKSGALLFQAGSETYRLTVSGSGTQSTVSWADVTPLQNLINDDPILATDPSTGVTLAGGGATGCGALSVTHDDGATWQASVPCTGTPDHPTVGIGPTGGGLLAADGGRAVYFCQQYPLVDECTTSQDSGATWLPAVPVTGGCIGKSGHVKVSRDGTAYLPMATCNWASQQSDVNTSSVGGAISRDGGRTWPSYMIPGATWPNRGFDPSVATTPNNTVYEVWGGAGNYHPLISWSRDHGTTWTKPLDLATTSRQPLAASAFHAAVAGVDGRVAVAFLGTPDAGTTAITPFDSGFRGQWYLYLSFTYDGGAHWQTFRALPQPVQTGGICDNGVTCIAGRNLLDFMDATVDASGRVVVGFAEGCHGGCPSGSTTQSGDAWAAIARQTTGRGLLFDEDVSTRR